jgi:hypothetical protein
VQAGLRPEATMTAGQLTAYAPLWNIMHRHLGSPPSWREPLQWVAEGFPGKFCRVDCPAKALEPFHSKKLAGVRAALKQTGLADAEISHIFQQARPPPMVLPNRVEAEHLEFVRTEIQTNCKRGSAIVWPFPATRPWVLLSLSVATNSQGKRRLILDARPVNLWLQYLAFSYERVQDVADYAQPGDFMVTRDLRAGYHHVALARSLWPLMGFQLEGVMYCFTCLPFGLSQAPYVFTRIMQCVHAVPRSWGYRMTDMVDDGANIARPAALLQKENRDVLFLQAAVGLVHAWDKCKIHPASQQVFLGFVVDLHHRSFLVPEHKLQRFHALTNKCLLERDAAAGKSALGLLASFAPALPLTPLLGRWLRLSAEGDRLVDEADAQFLEFWAQNVQRLNGRGWDHAIAPTVPVNAAAFPRVPIPPSPGQLQLVADASDHAFGAFLQGTDETWDMSILFTAAQASAMSQNSFSSTAREVTGFCAALHELHRTGKLSGVSHVQIWTDSQAAYADCTRMRGVPRVFYAVKHLYLLAWEYGLALEFVWVPRSHEALQYADFLSKRLDPTDWCFSRTFARNLVFDVLNVTPDLDCLASSSAHMCPMYFSAVYDGSCAAVNGFRQRWDQWPKEPHPQRKPMCWVFPPPSLLLPAAKKILTEQANAILVLPADTPQNVAQMLTDMQRQATRTLELRLTGPHARMVFPSPRVPARAAYGGWKTPLKAFVVVW